MIRTISSLVIFGLVATIATSASAANISVGNYQLAPNTANQLIPIFISGSDTTITGSDLFVLIGDGGPERTNFGITPAGVDAPGAENPAADVILAGTGPNGATIFNANHTTQFDIFSGEPSFGSIPQLLGFGITTNSGPVSDTPANSVLAYLRISTVGFNSGTWTVALNDSALGGTDFTDVVFSSNATPITLQNGSITISAVPEPNALFLGLFAVVGAISCLGLRAKNRKSCLAR